MGEQLVVCITWQLSIDCLFLLVSLPGWQRHELISTVMRCSSTVQGLEGAMAFAATTDDRETTSQLGEDSFFTRGTSEALCVWD